MTDRVVEEVKAKLLYGSHYRVCARCEKPYPWAYWRMFEDYCIVCEFDVVMGRAEHA